MNILYPWFFTLIPLYLLLLNFPKNRTSVTVPSLRTWPNREAGRARYLWLPTSLRHLSVLLTILALARPQAGSTQSIEVSEGIAIQLLVDVSSSMDMSVLDIGDKRSSRIEVAKSMVQRFIAGDGERLQGRPNDLIGLITFARYADTCSPLTFGHDALLQIVNGLEIQTRPNEDGTAYGDALAIAAARLNNPESLKHGSNSLDIDALKSRVIILLTDGENNAGNHLPIEAAGLAKAWDCRIYAISLGDNNNDENLEELSNAEKTLEHISLETGGIFQKAYDFESLLSVYEAIDKLERSEISTRSFERVAEWFWLPLLLSILALFSSLIIEATWLRIAP